MVREVNPADTSRASAYELWMDAPNPMLTFFKTLDVSNLIRLSKSGKYKFNMLMSYCIGKAASQIKEFYLLPVGKKLIEYDTIAVNIIVENTNGELGYCDILCTDCLKSFDEEYVEQTKLTADTLKDRDLSDDCMVIGTSAILETEIDGVVGMNSGIYNNPFIFWGRYRKRLFKYYLPISFQFHHTQMDGAHAGRFLENLQIEINKLK